jgi:TatD DNase family protein
LIDAHCHLDDAAFDADRDAVFVRSRAVGVVGWLVAGVDPATWARQRALAVAEPGIRWAAGLHPCAVARASIAEREAALIALPSCFQGVRPASALGETGLDTRFVPRDTLEAQVSAFRAQVALARALDLPVVLHLNGPGTHGRALAVLRGDGLPRRGGVVHAYSGSAELVADYVALGLYLSFAGTVARPDARRVHGAARATPGPRLLVETDAPDLAPPGAPRRNEPAALPEILRALAQLRGEDPGALAEQTARNAAELFGAFAAHSAPNATDPAPSESLNAARRAE